MAKVKCVSVRVVSLDLHAWTVMPPFIAPVMARACSKTIHHAVNVMVDFLVTIVPWQRAPLVAHQARQPQCVVIRVSARATKQRASTRASVMLDTAPWTVMLSARSILNKARMVKFVVVMVTAPTRVKRMMTDTVLVPASARRDGRATTARRPHA